MGERREIPGFQIDVGEDGECLEIFLSCERCGELHALREPAFGLPDAVFAQPGGRNDPAVDATEDVCRIDGRSFFIRCVAKLPVIGLPREWGIGLWLQVGQQDWEAFVEADGHPHDSIPGRIANQANYWGATLGLTAEAVYAGDGLRPVLKLLDERAMLARLQRTGVDANDLRTLMSRELHEDEPDPPGSVHHAELGRDGWELLDAEEFRPEGFQDPTVRVGAFVKVPVAFLSADGDGHTQTLIAGWWVKVDEVGHAGSWSGTLANYPPVPANVRFGSRLWGTGKNLIGHDPDGTPT